MSPIFNLSLIILIIAQLSFAYNNSGIAIYDLYGLDIASLNTEAYQWTVSSQGTSSAKTTTIAQVQKSGKLIGPYYVIGGPGVLGPSGSSAVNQYFERIYTGLVPHTTLTVYLEMFFWGTAWDTNVFSFSINVDGNMVGETNLQGYGSDTNPALFLGRELIKATTSHSASTTTLRLINLLNVDSDTASFGFHNVTIYLSNATASTSFCQRSMDNTNAPSNQPCACMKWSGYTYLYNQTKDMSGNCVDCSANCQVCYGTAISQCMLCNPGYTWVGDSCWDGTCNAACASCWGPGSNSCSNCQAGFYSYPNGTCSQVCTASYYTITNSSGLYCQVACPANLQPYPNYTCLTLSVITNEDVNVNVNVSSPALCTPPNIYLYKNSTCIATCQSPLLIITQANGVSYCSNFCADSEPYYYPAYKSCSASCDSPYTLIGNNTCAYTLSPAEQAQVASFSGYITSLNQVSYMSTMISIVVMFSDPSSVCLISLTKMLFYIRYMDIAYPPLLQSILDKQKASSDGFTFLKGTRENIKSTTPNQYLPWVFRKYNLNSTFLISFWTPLFLILGMIILILLSLIIEPAMKIKPTYLNKFKKIQQTLMWNFFVSRFMTNYDEAIFFNSLDFRTTDLSTTISNASFLAGIFILVITAAVILKLFHTFYNMQKFYKRNGCDTKDSQVREFEKEYNGYSMSGMWDQTCIYSFKILVYGT